MNQPDIVVVDIVGKKAVLTDVVFHKDSSARKKEKLQKTHPGRV